MGVNEGGSSWVGPFDDPDRYELLHRHSSGGEGELWRGTISVGRAAFPVAIKIVHKHHVTNLDEWRVRWRRQAEVLRSLDHPGLVKVREFFEGPSQHGRGESRTNDPRTLYLVMNWIEGIDLAAWVRGHPSRNVRTSFNLMQRVAHAVDHLHSGLDTGIEIIHRDIKPQNIIVNNKEVKLVDFGFVRMLGDESMTIVGTPDYMAPELLRTTGKFSPRTDRFSFGVTTFVVLTGVTPSDLDEGALRSRLARAFGTHSGAEAIDRTLRMIDHDPAVRPDRALDWIQSIVESLIEDKRSEVIAPLPSDDPRYWLDFIVPDDPTPIVPVPAPTKAKGARRSQITKRDLAPATTVVTPAQDLRQGPADREQLRMEPYRLALLLTAGDADWAHAITMRAIKTGRGEPVSADQRTWPTVRDEVVAQFLYPDWRSSGRRRRRPSTRSAEPLWKALAAMPRTRRAIVVLHLYESLTDRQIAKCLGISVSKVAGGRARGISSLRDAGQLVQ